MKQSRGSPWGAGLYFCPLLPDVSCCVGGVYTCTGMQVASLLIRDLAATTTCRVLQGAQNVCLYSSPSVYGFTGPLYEQVALVFYWWMTVSPMDFHLIPSKRQLVLRISVNVYFVCSYIFLFFPPALEQIGKDNRDHVQKMEWPKSALSDWETILY